MSVLLAFRGPVQAHPLGACLLAAVAWWTAHFLFSLAGGALPDAHAPLALGIAALAGYGLVGWLAWREAPARLGRSGPRGLRPADLLGLALLLPAYPIGAALERFVRAAPDAPSQPAALQGSSEALLGAGGGASLSALLVFVLVLPAIEEIFFRGLILPGLASRLGARRGLLLATAISAVAMAGLRDSTGEWLAVAACALLWAPLLGLVRLATGSVASAVLLRTGLAALWGADLLLMQDDRGIGPWLLALCSASVAAGVWLFRRGLTSGKAEVAGVNDAPAASKPESPPRRLRFPGVGLALGAGMLVAECVVVLRGILETFGGTGIWKELSISLASYMAIGAILDAATQLALPARLRRSRIARALPVLIFVFLVEHRFGAWSIVAFGVTPVAAAWAWTTSVRWARPLTAAMALVAIVSALPARATTAPAPAAVSPPPGSPSFVVVVLDTVRRDHCSLYGYARRTTPNLDALARRGVRFDAAYSASCWSVESHASLFTGLLPHNHGATFEHMRLAERHPTLPSILAAQGYDTAAFSGNPYVTAGTGMARGFSVFMDLWRPFVMRRALAAMQVGASLGRTQSDKGGASVVTEIKRWVSRRDQSRPYFMFVNLMEAHSPYQDAPLYRKFADRKLSRGQLEQIGRESHDAQWLGSPVRPESMATTVDLMDGATASADAYLGEILAAVGEDPIVVVLSDHGDLIGEHNLFGHMTGLYEPLIRIPLVVAGPGVTRGASVAGPVSTIDVMPTVLSLARLPAQTIDGTDFAAALRGAALPSERPIIAEHYRNPGLALWSQHRSEEELAGLRARRMAVVIASRKRVVAEDGSDVGYDLSTDPGELKPVPGAGTGVAATVPPNPGPSGTVEMDPAQIEMLRSLGYVNTK